jgi:hypothetical protein
MPFCIGATYSLGTPNYLVDKLKTLSRFLRFKLEYRMTILAAAAGLAYVLALCRNLLSDRFAIRDLRLSNVRIYLELAQKAVNDDFQMKLSHTGDNDLPRLLISKNTE